MTPLITIQVLGLVFKHRQKAELQTAEASAEDIIE